MTLQKRSENNNNQKNTRAANTEFKCNLQDGRTLRLNTLQNLTCVAKAVAKYLANDGGFGVNKEAFNKGCVLNVPAGTENLYFICFNLQNTWRNHYKSTTQFVVQKLLNEGLNWIIQSADLIVYKNTAYQNDDEHAVLRAAAKQNITPAIAALVAVTEEYH
jgi:hypothetical protein